MTTNRTYTIKKHSSQPNTWICTVYGYQMPLDRGLCQITGRTQKAVRERIADYIERGVLYPGTVEIRKNA